MEIIVINIATLLKKIYMWYFGKIAHGSLSPGIYYNVSLIFGFL